MIRCLRRHRPITDITKARAGMSPRCHRKWRAEVGSEGAAGEPLSTADLNVVEMNMLIVEDGAKLRAYARALGAGANIPGVKIIEKQSVATRKVN